GALLNFGLEYRTEEQDLEVEEPYKTGDNVLAAVLQDTRGQFNVHDIFSEVRIPLVDDRFLVRRFAIDGSYRASNFSSAANDVHTYKGGLFYAPVKDVGFRGSFQRATRAPSINEAYGPQSVIVGGLVLHDPCAGAQLDKNGDGVINDQDVALGAATLEQCERTGVTQQQYNSGSIQDCPGGL